MQIMRLLKLYFFQILENCATTNATIIFPPVASCSSRLPPCKNSRHHKDWKHFCCRVTRATFDDRVWVYFILVIWLNQNWRKLGTHYSDKKNHTWSLNVLIVSLYCKIFYDFCQLSFNSDIGSFLVRYSQGWSTYYSYMHSRMKKLRALCLLFVSPQGHETGTTWGTGNEGKEEN